MAPPSDIAVVGAGVVGCAVAFELARRGASVEILDDRGAGMGSTQAAAGMLAPFSEARDGGPLLDLTTRSLALYDELVETVTSETGLTVTYRRTGSLDIALTPDALATLALRRDAMRAHGVEPGWLDPAAIRDVEPGVSPRALGGLLIAQHGFVAAFDLTRALLAAARRRGARMIEHGRVRRVVPGAVRNERAFVIETERGSLRAGAVVLAAGSWAGQLDVGSAERVPVKPIRGQLLQLAWTARPLARITWGDGCYMVPRSDGTVLVGATVEEAGFDERTTVEGVRQLIDAACELVPDTNTASLTAARVGLRPGTPDHLPIVGWSSSVPGLMYATGHFRNGVLLAPLTAQLVADAMLENRQDPMLEWMMPSRFGNV